MVWLHSWGRAKRWRGRTKSPPRENLRADYLQTFASLQALNKSRLEGGTSGFATNAVTAVSTAPFQLGAARRPCSMLGTMVSACPLAHGPLLVRAVLLLTSRRVTSLGVGGMEPLYGLKMSWPAASRGGQELLTPSLSLPSTAGRRSRREPGRSRCRRVRRPSRSPVKPLLSQLTGRPVAHDRHRALGCAPALAE